MGSGRFELPTSSMSTMRSNQLSYEPDNIKYTNPFTLIATESIERFFQLSTNLCILPVFENSEIICKTEEHPGKLL